MKFLKFFTSIQSLKIWKQCFLKKYSEKNIWNFQKTLMELTLNLLSVTLQYRVRVRGSLALGVRIRVFKWSSGNRILSDKPNNRIALIFSSVAIIWNFFLTVQYVRTYVRITATSVSTKQPYSDKMLIMRSWLTSYLI